MSSPQRFSDLMQAYAARARAVHSGFEFNPSPGNIRDGLITDAIKSAGAARKGGVIAHQRRPRLSRVRDQRRGFNLQCTPGNDVESVTAQVGAGSNLVLFTTGLGTPTGNPDRAGDQNLDQLHAGERMDDIIDFDAGPIVSGEVDDQGQRRGAA